MNIFFFGGTSLAAQDLVASLQKDNKVYILSRKKKLKKNFYYFDLNKKNNLKFKNLKKNDENYLFFLQNFFQNLKHFCHHKILYYYQRENRIVCQLQKDFLLTCIHLY